MTIIYRKNDLVDLKIADLTFKIKPLSYQERTEIMSCLSNQNGNIVENASLATFKTMKYSIRDLLGATLLDGSEYKIEKDESGNISDESIDDLLNLEGNDKLGMALYNFLKGVPTTLVDPNTGETLEGVEIIAKDGLPKK